MNHFYRVVLFCIFLMPVMAFSQITVTIFEDKNGNGIRDGGEVGLGGFNPQLYFDQDMDGTTAEFNTGIVPTQPIVGTYVFTVPSNGIYQVVFQSPVGTYLILNPVSGTSPLLNYPADNTALAGYYVPGSVNGEVFHDVNGNGQDDDAGGLPTGIDVLLTNATDFTTYGPVNTTGTYSFTDLPPGNYYVTFESGTAAPFVLTFQNIGSDLNDSDPDRITGETASFMVMSGQDVLNVDAGYYEPVTIGDFVWEDMNGNGVQDGEPPYPGLTVTLTGTTGAGTAFGPVNVFTNGAGLYQFTNVPPGSYTVTFGALPANFYYTMANMTSDDLDSDPNLMGVTPAVIVVSGAVVDNIDAGVFEAVEISNFVWEDLNGNGLQDGGEPGIPGVSISIRTALGGPVTKADGTPAAPVLSGAGGIYLIDKLKPGDYIVTFGTFAPYFRTLKGAGNVMVDSDANQTTGDTDVITLQSGEMTDEIDGGYYRSCMLGNFCWIDFNGDGQQNDPNPLPGVTISITDDMGNPVTDVNGNPVNSLVSNGAGNYVFNNLKPGTYKLTFTPPGGYYPCRFNAAGGPDDPTDVPNDSDVDQGNANMTFDIELTSNENEQDIDGGFYQPVSIGNFVWHDQNANGVQDGGEPGVENVQVQLTFRNGWVVTDVFDNPVLPAVTDAAGNYTFNNLRPGEYNIMVNPPAMWLFSDPNVGGDATDNDFDAGGIYVPFFIINSGETTTNVDAGIYKNIIVIGTVWVEQDDDGVQQLPAELGLAGVTVNILGSPGGAVVATSTTNANGEYMFEVKPGDYTISVVGGNFGPGNPLNGLVSCTPTSDPNNDVDLDDNGDGPDLGPVETAVVNFLCGEEPDPDGVTNETIDFCFKFDCDAQNSLAAASCDMVMDTFCDLTLLDVGCARMPSPPLVQPAPNPLCNGQGAPHNMSWFAFIAGQGNYTIEIVPFACTTVGNQQGVQAGIYTDCTFTNAVACFANPCHTDPIQIPSDAFTPGSTYFFWIDGCGGSVCSYEINVLGEFQQYTIQEPTEVVCISDECSPICPNNTIALQVLAGFENLSAFFTWKITSPTGVVTRRTTTKDTLNYTVTQLGTYTFTIEKIKNKCHETFVEKSITIEVKHPADEDFGRDTLCPNLVSFYTGPTSDDMGNSDPNMDGKNGWLNSGFAFQKGMNMTTIMDDGCIFKQKVFVDTFALSPPYNARMILCHDQFPVSIGGLLWTGPIDPFPIMLLDHNGCDSTIIVELIDLYVTGTFEELGCAQGGYTLKFNYDPLVIPGLSTIIRWKNSAGQYINDGNIDGDPTTMTVPSSGVYTVEITLTLENKTCVLNYPYTLNLGNLVPAIPVKLNNWVTDLCATSDTLRYVAMSTDGETDFTWTVPSGLPYVNGINNDTLEIVWGNTSGGEICVFTSNLCGNSPKLCDTVNVTPYPVASFTADSVLCITNLATVISQGPDQSSYTYNWDLSGGSIVAGPGSNGRDSLTVQWGSGGNKVITLSINNDGCVSTATPDSVMVVVPLPDPAISCNTGSNSIEFYWTAPAGQTMAPAINVTTGQSGVLSGNTFTVSGLVPGVTVDIAATFFVDHPCGNLTSTGSCITQNCTPEQTSFDPIPDICLTASSPVVNLKNFINSTTTNGTYVFTGPGITNAANGTFDPNVAGVSPLPHQIRLVYTDATGCISPAAFVDILVKPTPTSDFTFDPVICQDSTSRIVYTGSITGGGVYNWDFGADVKTPGTGRGPFGVDWNTPGVKTIKLNTSLNGCASTETTHMVTVEPRINPVSITCPIEGATMITFDWNDVANITGYELTLNGQPRPNTNVSNLVLTGLTVNTDYTLIVNAPSTNSCPGVSDTLTCRTSDCPPVFIKFSQKDTTLCLTANMPSLTINAIVTGGLQSPGQTITWTGPGVTVSANDKIATFNPNVAGAGTHTIKASLKDGTCTKDTTMKITIINKPVSTFTGDDVICITDPYTLMYTGTPNLPLDWKLPSGVTVSRIGQTNNYRVNFPSDGPYILGLVTGNPGCLSDLTNLNVQVDPELDTVMISCQQTTTSVTFTWNDINCASNYQVRINNVAKGSQSALTYNVTGLMIGENVEIEILPVSTCACPAIPSSRVCTAKDCPQIALRLDSPVSRFCSGSITNSINLDATATGSNGTGSGSWSGNGVTAQGVFDPAGKAPGKYTFYYNFTEENCDYRDSISLEIYPKPSAASATVQPDCYQDNFGEATVTVTGGTAPFAYLLNNAAATPPFTALAPASYQVLVTDDNGCTATTSFVINAASEPSVAISGAASVNKGGSVELKTTLTPATTVVDSMVWTNLSGTVVCSGANCATIQVTPAQNEKYCVTVFFNGGCTITDCFEVQVITIVDVILPNIISLSGGNPSFYVQSYSTIKSVKSMTIFDRWGNTVFTRENLTTGDPAQGWDAKFKSSPVTPGVYVYKVEVEYNDGTTEIFSGDVTVIR